MQPQRICLIFTITDYQINNYTDKDRDTNIPYLHFSRQLPIYKTKNTLTYPDYDQHVFKTLKNFNNLKVNYDLIHDYEITEDILGNIKELFFPIIKSMSLMI